MSNLADEYNNSYQRFIGRKPVDLDCSAFTEEIETNPKAPKFKAGDIVRITKYKNIFSKDYPGKWSKKIFVIDSVLKPNPCTYRIKDLNGKK